MITPKKGEPPDPKEMLQALAELKHMKAADRITIEPPMTAHQIKQQLDQQNKAALAARRKAQ